MRYVQTDDNNDKGSVIVYLKFLVINTTQTIAFGQLNSVLCHHESTVKNKI